jgi:hypothetical protein
MMSRAERGRLGGLATLARHGNLAVQLAGNAPPPTKAP